MDIKRGLDLDKFLDKKNTFAVIGVSKNPRKYGNIVYRDLKSAGYKVYPVNPNVDKISEDKCYSSLKDLPELPDVVDIVVPPKITESIVKEISKLGIKKIWMQPGSESEKAIKFCKENNIQALHNMCVMIKRKNRGKVMKFNKKIYTKHVGFKSLKKLNIDNDMVNNEHEVDKNGTIFIP